MCGLLGILGLSPDIALGLSDVNAARDVMAPRGPDAADTLEDTDANGNRLFLSHRRLSIQDLSAAAEQPMVSASGSSAIIYNGEVYNTDELRYALTQKGIQCRTSSDTELILEGYEVWGTEVLQRLNGIFAFLIWDKRTNTAFVARDRIGVKPLYFTQKDGVFACASDLRALSRLGFCETIDGESLALYLMLGYVPTPRAIYNNVHKLEPGAYLEWSCGGTLKKNRYWSPPTDTDYETRAPISDLIDQVVEEQLLSDVPIGLFLSGGIDSSVIASSIASLDASKTTDLTALSIAYPGRQEDNEAPVARRTAQALGIEFFEMPLTHTEDFSYEAATRAVDEPLGYTALVSQCAISQLASERGLKCVLTGDGGDEVFAGYRWYVDETVEGFVEQRSLGLKRRLKQFMPRGRAKQLDSRVGQTFRRQSRLAFHAARVFPALRPDMVSALAMDISERHATDLLISTLESHDAPKLPEKRRLQRIDLATFCLDAVLPKVDRAGMAYGVEARPPLLDHRIVEWGLSHPITPTFDDQPKGVLRDMLTARGLGFLLDEPKRGFSLKLASAPDRKSSNNLISQSLPRLGLSDDWKTSVTGASEWLSIKLSTLLFLSIWESQNRSSASG